VIVEPIRGFKNEIGSTAKELARCKLPYLPPPPDCAHSGFRLRIAVTAPGRHPVARPCPVLDTHPIMPMLSPRPDARERGSAFWTMPFGRIAPGAESAPPLGTGTPSLAEPADSGAQALLPPPDAGAQALLRQGLAAGCAGDCEDPADALRSAQGVQGDLSSTEPVETGRMKHLSIRGGRIQLHADGSTATDDGRNSRSPSASAHRADPPSVGARNGRASCRPEAVRARRGRIPGADD
jgi:hypothetical protein